MFDSGLSAFIWYCGAFHIYVHSTQLIVSGSPISRQVLGIFFCHPQIALMSYIYIRCLCFMYVLWTDTVIFLCTYTQLSVWFL
jgi:hypothetical protein